MVDFAINQFSENLRHISYQAKVRSTKSSVGDSINKRSIAEVAGDLLSFISH